jgi:hypothetical protein
MTTDAAFPTSALGSRQDLEEVLAHLGPIQRMKCTCFGPEDDRCVGARACSRIYYQLELLQSAGQRGISGTYYRLSVSKWVLVAARDIAISNVDGQNQFYNVC